MFSLTLCLFLTFRDFILFPGIEVQMCAEQQKMIFRINLRIRKSVVCWYSFNKPWGNMATVASVATIAKCDE